MEGRKEGGRSGRRRELEAGRKVKGRKKCEEFWKRRSEERRYAEGEM